MSSMAIQYVWLIPLLPLIGAAIAGLFGAKLLRGKNHLPIWIGVGASAVLSFMVLGAVYNAPTDRGTVSITKNIFTWMSVGDASAKTPGGLFDFLHVNVGYFIDPLTAVMLCVICGIGFLITVFAAGYMKGEEGYWRFFAYLGLFIFMMTNLVMGENLIMLYLGWEGVGLSSYLLIGYYYERPSARDAATKAFIVNRVGDFGFALGIMLCFAAFGTVSYFGQGFHTNTGLIELFTMPFGDMTSTQQIAVKWVPFLLMMGAFGKSAQFPLHVWLPDAMEGPTPVSALIHAATMVTAGVYMICRCSTMFFHTISGQPFSAPLTTVMVIGAFTALFAATIAMRQFDLKKVFAYSTVSQLGYMFVGAAVLGPVAAVFHLVTHAFFKALLFLSSGVVMHAMHDELDMRKMSGLKRVLPLTRWVMLAGCAALAGFPIVTSGFYSKDEIIGAAFAEHKVIAGVLLLSAFLTAYYTFRLYFRVFHGPVVVPEGEHHTPTVAHDTGAGFGHTDADHEHDHHNHEPWIMMAPLVILAIGAIIVGPLLYFVKVDLGPSVPEDRRPSVISNFLGKSPSFAWDYVEASSTFEHVSADEIGITKSMDGALVPEDKEIAAEEHQTHLYLMIASGVLSLAGIGVAFLLHKQNRAQADALAAKFAPITRVLDHKYWIDEAYNALIVQPLWKLAKAMAWFDQWVIDLMVWIVGIIPQVFGFSLRITVQRGYLQGYATAMVFGIVVILVAIFVF